MTIRPPVNLEYIGVPVGAILTLADKDHVAVVVVQQYPPRVVYEEQVLSLTQAAKRAYDTPEDETIQATLYWRYEGESLWDRRMRFEKHHNSRFQDS
ncbi:MAG: hypothetical protein OXI80_08350 [Caldilineaceae bacterium]|nr:hypothetical protein [Caldilineaceae bacterium]MDE0337668.1 hypothetical protein [Caldilineaceae bacterium]